MGVNEPRMENAINVEAKKVVDLILRKDVIQNLEIHVNRAILR